MRIPDYSELTDSQRNIANLPPISNYVITGEPGTGKTVIALYMAKNFTKQGKKVLFLIYNRPLKQFIDSQIFGAEAGFKVTTFDKWINESYYSMCGKPTPKDGGAYSYDWNIITKDFSNIEKQYDYIIFDEAQDFSLETLQAVSLVTKNMACYLDPEQSFAENAVSVEELLAEFDLRNEYTLEDNFRNTKEIFEFAKIYGHGLNIVGTRNSGSKPVFIKASEYEEQIDKIMEVIRENATAKTIAVFANSQSVQNAYDHIIESSPNKDVFLYNPRNRDFKNLDFSKDGIYVMPYNCVKGLEFDVVINMRVDQIKRTYGMSTDNMFYVACTRARKNLYCMYYYDTTYNDNFIDVFGPLSQNRKLVEWRE